MGSRDLDRRGVNWIDELPPVWPTHPVKRYFDVQLGKMLQNVPSGQEDRPAPYLKALHVRWGNVETDDLPEMWASPSDIRQYGIQPGDLLVCEGGEVGRAGVIIAPPPNCIIQNSLHRIRARKSADVRFLQYVLQAAAVAGWFNVLCNRATIAHFTREKLAELRIPLPGLSEQQAVAAFLDRETARIDALIEKKQRQVMLIEEQRRSLIRNSVTRGLNGKASMQKTSMPLAPEMPRHWRALRLRRLGRVDQGCAFSEDIQGAAAGEIPWYKVNDMTCDGNEESMGEAENYVSADVARVAGATIFPAGTIIFPRVGGALLTNKRRLLSCPAIIDDNTYGFVPEGIDSRFSYFILTLLDMASICSPGLVPTVTIPTVKDVQIPVPPMDEQRRIAAHIDRVSQQSNRLAEKLRESIKLLNEFRATLISGAVTGKASARGEVAI